MLDATCPTEDLIEAAAAGMPGGEEVIRHAQSCARCGEVLAKASSDIALLDSVKTVVAHHAKKAVGLPATGDHIGAYEIIDVLHKGGQGIVYKAHHAATKRDVALKVLLGGGFATKDQVARFHREAELVAHLDHPGIVTVYDSGFEEGGLAYLVMELVEGRDLGKWIEQERESRSPREIVALFADICDAVAHAHQRGVIHRDLKPSNIVVNEADQPRVLDFGIAKVTQSQPDAESEGVTREGEFVGTFLYASPEQVTAGSAMVDIRTDVFAIGMMLYEALAGQRAYELKGGIAEVVRIIREAKIDPPGLLNPRVDNELDTIVLKALANDAARRYQSVRELGADLRRYLAGDPIEAKRDSRAYVARKLAWKYKVPIGVGLAFVTVLIGATIGMSLFAFRADRARDEATSNARAAVGGIKAATQEAGAKQIQTAGDFLDILEQEYQTAQGITAATRSEILAAIGVMNQDLGRYEQARTIFQDILSTHESGALADPIGYADTLFNLGRVNWRLAEFDAARVYYEQCLERRRALFGDQHADVATVLHHLGSTYTQLTDHQRAEQLLLSALKTRRAVLEPDDLEIDNTLNSLVVCYREQSKYREAAQRAEELLPRLIARLGEYDWRVGRTRHNLGANLADLGEYDRALEELRKALDNKIQWRGREHVETARTLTQLARVMLNRAEWTEARLDADLVTRWCEEALAVQSASYGPTHPDHIATEIQLMRVLMHSGDHASAAAMGYRLLAIIDADASPESEWRSGEVRGLLAICEINLDRCETAIRHAEAAVGTVEKMPGARVREQWATLMRAGKVFQECDRLNRAAGYLAQARKLLGEGRFSP